MRPAFSTNKRSRETALVVEPEIFACREIGDAVLSKKIRSDLFLRPFVSECLGTVLADLSYDAQGRATHTTDNRSRLFD